MIAGAFSAWSEAEIPRSREGRGAERRQLPKEDPVDSLVQGHHPSPAQPQRQAGLSLQAPQPRCWDRKNRHFRFRRQATAQIRSPSHPSSPGPPPERSRRVRDRRETQAFCQEVRGVLQGLLLMAEEGRVGHCAAQFWRASRGGERGAGCRRADLAAERERQGPGGPG